MKLSAATLVAAVAALAAQPARGWTITHRGPRGEVNVESGTGNYFCGYLFHAAGQRLQWDRADGSYCCVKFYTSLSCGGLPAARRCSDWQGITTLQLRSYKVEGC